MLIYAFLAVHGDHVLFIVISYDLSRYIKWIMSIIMQILQSISAEIYVFNQYGTLIV